MLKKYARLFVLLTSLCALSCSSDKESPCLDLTGKWQVTSHCVESQKGVNYQVTQKDECGITIAPEVAQQGYTFSGTLVDKTNIKVIGGEGDENIDCSGTYTSQHVILSCKVSDGDCPLRLERQ